MIGLILKGVYGLVGVGVLLGILKLFNGDPFALVDWVFTNGFALVNRVADWIATNDTLRSLLFHKS